MARTAAAAALPTAWLREPAATQLEHLADLNPEDAEQIAILIRFALERAWRESLKPRAH